MRQKALHNGLCLQCGKESKRPFCNRTCYREHVRSGVEGGRVGRMKSEKRRRDSLTDGMVRKTIYISSNKKIKGVMKWDDITTEMIIEKRKQILEWRNRKNKPVIKKKKVYICKICGNEFETFGSYCSDDCRKEKARIDDYNRNSAKKDLRARSCKECGKQFIPEYGNKRRSFCSTECLHKYKCKCKTHDARKRARESGVFYEYVNPLKVFARDGWRCQFCGKKLNPKHRGTMRQDAPELDHIIPWAKGGEHSYRNTQCACRKCNADKGSRELGQERLFG